MTLRTSLRAALLHSTVLALLASSLAACGGGGGSLKLPPTNRPDDHADAPADATLIRAGGGVIQGSIDYQGDTDFFRFEGRPGVTYTIRRDDIDVAVQPTLDLSFALFAADGVTPLPNSADTDLTGAVLFDNELRFVMTPEVRSGYYIRIRSVDPFATKNNYRWIMTSSEQGRTVYTHRLFQDRTFGNREIAEFDQDGLLITTHPIDFSPPFTNILSMFFRFGDPDVQVDPAFQAGFFIPEITLLNGTDPETGAIHVHLGFPEIIDSQPFAVPSDPNFNNQVDTDDHPILFEIPIDVPITEFPREVWHAIVGHDTYIDIHVSDNLDVIPAPLTSTPPFGGFSLFESEFRLTGDQVVPPTGLSLYDCTLLYLADQKVFQWDLTRFEYNGSYLDEVRLETNPPTTLFRPNPPADIVGLPINIRQGFPGQNGAIVLPLGNVVAGAQDANGPGELDTDRDIKNVQRVLTDQQVSTLRSITYGTRQTQTVTDITGANRQVTYLGWYIQVENAGVPVIRYDAALFRDRFLRGYEVARTDPMPVQFRQLDGGAVTGVEHLGEITFVTDYASGGPVEVSVDGIVLSHLNAAFTGDIPGCGEGGQGETVRVMYGPGVYGYEAEAEDGTRWVGTVEIPSAGSCVTVALLEAEAN